MANIDEAEAFIEPIWVDDLDDLTSEDEPDMFAFVRENIDLEQLSRVASLVRPGFADKLPSVGDPIRGSFNILYPLHFEDGMRWLAKVPINGVPGKWDQLSADAMVSEVNTMRLLNRETTIPLPEVFWFSSTTENDVKCPYILLSFISGMPLYDVWFGHRLSGVDMETTHERRMRALRDIGEAMSQLGKFSFNSSGFLKFDEEGDPSSVGQSRCLDHQEMLDRLDKREDDSDDLVYVEAPAFEDAQQQYNFFLDLHLSTEPCVRGVSLLLKELIKWIPEPTNEKPFVLAHPDFDIQNFLVSEDGQLLGIIDWDGVCCSPRSYGNEAYPGWLTRDWDPMMYGYNESMGEGEEPVGCWEDSPKTLQRYRIAYDEIMSEFCERDAGINLTKISLITQNLMIAAGDPMCRLGIVDNILEKISLALELAVPLNFLDLDEAFADDSITDEVRATLERGMKKLFQDAR
ncbi:unnamed protein product [Clonostachys chloroleuca]|uniref:Aminoglycoside phosphotransferase domain-containing protein n=1 Tax=Clonostachys chloroleuca TaxID=1926264 RepID=A0AA35M9I4_9HYPO|nr:unnamed protein product [Clonostachys chloroleuca]